MSVFAGPEIVNRNLIFSVDSANIKSYSGSGDVWTNGVDGYASTGGSSLPSQFNNPAEISSAPLTALTVICVVTLLGTSAAYAYHPVSKWTGTADATFVLYHFQEFTDSLRTYRLGWYGNSGGTWNSLSPWFTGSQNQTYHIVLQYNSTNGGQMWINGSKFGGRTSSGTLMNNNQNIAIDGGPQSRAGIHQTKEVTIYNAELTDAEIKQNFNATRARYSI
jgi:hypothetical protein